MSSTQSRTGSAVATTSLHAYRDGDVAGNVTRSQDGEYIISFKVKHREVITVWLDDSQAMAMAMAFQSLLPKAAELTDDDLLDKVSKQSIISRAMSIMAIHIQSQSAKSACDQIG